MALVRKVLYLFYQPYKWLIYFPFVIINTIFFGVVAVLSSILINQKIGSYLGGVLWSRLNATLVPMVVNTSGKENIQKGRSYIVVSNHQSYYDIFAIYGWLGLDIKWVMKKELGNIPGLGWGSKKVGHIFLDRSNKRAALQSLADAKRKLVNGTSVIIFPEGTRSKTGIPDKFKRGGFKLAMDLELPILPITINGTHKIMPSGTLDLFPGKVELIVHQPIEINDFNDVSMNVLIDRVHDIIGSALPK